MNQLFILLQGQAGSSAMWTQMGMFLIIGVVFYFFMIRPQQQKQKEAKKFQDGLSSGSKVITAGGVHGKVIKSNTEDGTLSVEIDQGVVIKIEKSSINYELSKKLN